MSVIARTERRGASGARMRSLCALLLLVGAGTADAAPRNVYVLTPSNGIALVPETQPGQASAAITIIGINVGEDLMAIDVRPQNGRLYGLGFNAVVGSVQLYHLTVDATSALATAVGTSGSFVNAGGAPVPVAGTAFGIDFNPATDRLRVNTDSGQNFRMNPNTGAFVDGDLGGAAGSVAGVNMDGAINGGSVAVDDAAYTNNVINAAVTTLYTIDKLSNVLWIQNPPNAGTQTAPLLVTLGGSPLDFSGEVGLDIPLGVNAPSSNAGGVGVALAALTVAGAPGLYRIDLGTGATTSMGALGLATRDIAIAAETATAHVLTADGLILLRKRLADPATGPAATLSGVVAGERLVGIDGRPSTGQMYGLGVNAVANTGTVYVLDPQTGATTVIGSAGQVAFVDAGGLPIDFPDGSWGVDFNPSVDRIRVNNTSGANFRLNPINGAPVDGNQGGAAGSVPGINMDGPINGAVGVGLAGAAYSNNFAGATVTTLYTLDPQGNRLFIQNPANAGVQTVPRAVTQNGLPFDFVTTAGFDIPPGVNAPLGNAEAVGDGYAVLGVSGGLTSLYQIDLPSGAVQVIGPIGAGTSTVEGLAVWATLPSVLFSDSFE